MPFQEEEVTESQLLQRERCERFATQTAGRIRSTENCLFSVLPQEELSRIAAGWYEACAQAMLRGNYAPVDSWARSQCHMAAAQGFMPEDLYQLMLLCRRSAVELESWNEDVFSAVDDVMNDAFSSARAKLKWNIAETLVPPTDTSKGAEASVSIVEARESPSDRRRFTRNRLQFPIRVRGTSNKGQVDEITRTESVSRGGLYFLTRENYQKEQVLKIVFPYWSEHGGINKEYSVKVVRLDSMPDKSYGIGVDFLKTLGCKEK